MICGNLLNAGFISNLSFVVVCFPCILMAFEFALLRIGLSVYFVGWKLEPLEMFRHCILYHLVLDLVKFVLTISVIRIMKISRAVELVCFICCFEESFVCFVTLIFEFAGLDHASVRQVMNSV